MHQLEGECWRELSLESIREIIGMSLECKSPVSRVTRYSSRNICISKNRFQLSSLYVYFYLCKDYDEEVYNFSKVCHGIRANRFVALCYP